MAGNQSATNSENKNTESRILKKPVCKRPKCVSFAFWWFILLGIIYPLPGILYYNLSTSHPWTECAGDCVVGLLMLYCARMISKRNVTAVFMSAISLFFSMWILTAIESLVLPALLPMIFLVLPHSIRWLKLNNRFSVPTLIVSALMVFSSGVLCLAPSITHSVISNKNPLLVALPGNKAQHKVNEKYRDRYHYWQHGRKIGDFIAQYNQDGRCCYVELDILSSVFWGFKGEKEYFKTKEEYAELFWENVIDICNQRFGKQIRWSDAITVKSPVTEEGLPMLCGIVDKKIVMIFPRVEETVYGSLLICDSQLNSELDFLFSLPDENSEIALLDTFLEIRDRILSVERDVDDSTRNDICDGLRELRDRASMLHLIPFAIESRMCEIEDQQVAKIVELFELRRKTMCELAAIIWGAAHMAVTAIEYNTKALTMRRAERIQLRRQYLEKENAPVLDELLPIDPKDHSGQNKIFDGFAKALKEDREELYWELHEKTGYSLGRPYNPKFMNRDRRRSPVAPDQHLQKDEASDSIYNNPLIRDYGNPDRAKLFSAPFRKGLGMY